jgi:mono/diheme cytochrome c family protein
MKVAAESEGAAEGMMRKSMRVTAMAGIAAAAIAGCASIRTGDPAKGEAVATQWCSQCHAIRGTETDPKRPPTFEQVAARSGRDRAYLQRFLNEDHFPMTTYRLLDPEKEDVVALILSLRR